MCAFSWFKKYWSVSLYTDKDIDVSKVCAQFGGSGHKKAAGFTTARPIFEIVRPRPINLEEIDE